MPDAVESGTLLCLLAAWQNFDPPQVVQHPRLHPSGICILAWWTKSSPQSVPLRLDAEIVKK